MVLQGYNVDIRHIPGKKNPADSLSRQLITDALVRKSSVTDANAEYVQRLRVPEDATNEQIQDALYRLFNSSPQGKDSQIQADSGPQGQTVLSKQTPQGSILSTNEEQCPQGNQSKQIIAATAVSKVQLDNSFKDSLHSLLQHESPYAEILQELQSGTRQVVRNSLVFKRMHGILYVHDQNQDVDLDFWRIVVPDDEQNENPGSTGVALHPLQCTSWNSTYHS